MRPLQRRQVDTVYFRQFTVALHAVAMARTTLHPKYIDNIGLVTAERNKGASPTVHPALGIGIRGSLHHLHETRPPEEQKSRFSPAANLVLVIHGHQVVTQGRSGPGIAGIVPNVAPVRSQLPAEGIIHQAQGILVAVTMPGVSIEVKRRGTMRPAAAQDGDMPIGKPFRMQGKRGGRRVAIIRPRQIGRTIP